MTASSASRWAFCCFRAFSSASTLTPSMVPPLSSMIFAVTSSVGAPAFRPSSSQTALLATVASSPGCLPSLRLLFSAAIAWSASIICSSVASGPSPSAAASFCISMFSCPPSKLSELTIGVMFSIAGVLVRARECSPMALLSVLRTLTTGER